MAAIPKLNDPGLQAICDILGATDTGLTGSEIGRYLHECGCPDPIPQMTKRHRLYAALSAKQNEDRCANNVLARLLSDYDLASPIYGIFAVSGAGSFSYST
jgi:hypothetical protein